MTKKMIEYLVAEKRIEIDSCITGLFSNGDEFFSSIGIDPTVPFTIEYDYGWNEERDYYITQRIMAEREETDSEYNKRIQQEERQAISAQKRKETQRLKLEKERIKKEENDKKLYEKLKKKYGEN